MFQVKISSDISSHENLLHTGHTEHQFEEYISHKTEEPLYTSPQPVLQRSVSATDVSSLVNSLSSSIDEEVHIISNPFSEIQNGGSVPYLVTASRRPSIPNRVLVNPTPATAKSLGQLDREELCPSSTKEKRRCPAKSRSNHSVFECEEGCFSETETGEGNRKKSQQLVTVWTGPLVI